LSRAKTSSFRERRPTRQPSTRPRHAAQRGRDRTRRIGGKIAVAGVCRPALQCSLPAMRSSRSMRNLGPTQIRNSNSYSLAVQIQQNGGEPVLLPIAPDEPRRLRQFMEQGLQSDLLLMTGGVSMGRYDLVEQVLAETARRILFHRSENSTWPSGSLRTRPVARAPSTSSRKLRPSLAQMYISSASLAIRSRPWSPSNSSPAP
jgi:hypothetical protein